ncbi:hypothetical protein DPEC_G00099250 [Dallia pectoralis]|uniref:Uncharacterized protein n=1 Tax=Dallia pectoralis TaxID=75939 RepID=A0ACC2GWT5_DALPE|nr:hypothetical protein DPEC_G00099250 [Dallia pectoralis]
MRVQNARAGAIGRPLHPTDCFPKGRQIANLQSLMQVVCRIVCTRLKLIIPNTAGRWQKSCLRFCLCPNPSTHWSLGPCPTYCSRQGTVDNVLSCCANPKAATAIRSSLN